MHSAHYAPYSVPQTTSQPYMMASLALVVLSLSQEPRKQALPPPPSNVTKSSPSEFRKVTRFVHREEIELSSVSRSHHHIRLNTAPLYYLGFITEYRGTLSVYHQYNYNKKVLQIQVD